MRLRRRVYISEAEDLTPSPVVRDLSLWQPNTSRLRQCIVFLEVGAVVG